MSTFIVPLISLVGIIGAAAFGAFGKEWYAERRLRRRALSPGGLAEAEAINLAVSLDREKWLDLQTRGLFDTVHEQLERALTEVGQLRAQVRQLADDVTQLSIAAVTADAKRVEAERLCTEAERQRDELRVLVSTIQNGRLP